VIGACRLSTGSGGDAVVAPPWDVLINGELVAPGEAAVSVFDIGFQRGYGCFEGMRSYDGRVFRSRQHIDRLVASAESLKLPSVDTAALAGWIDDRASAAGDAVIRVFVTGGTDVAVLGTNSKTIVTAQPLPEIPESVTLLPVRAPWHSDGTDSELTGAKTMSYGPNVAATQSARIAGFDDALLTGIHGHVLEGPTYSVAWIRNGVVETPELGHGILESITRGAVVEVARSAQIRVVEDVFGVDRLFGADEVFIMSTVREVMPVTRVGDRRYGVGAITKQLQVGFANLVDSELGPGSER
jgi:branched-subunit amino acid aminotransferase/4-amino-4-deoxychorismate lyase